MARRARLARARRALGVTRATRTDVGTSVEADGARGGVCGALDALEDPLEAYMAREVAPEVARAEAARAAAEAAARTARAAEMARARAVGERVKRREDVLVLEREEAVEAAREDPDEVIEIPTTRVRLVIGAGGANVKELMKKSGARIQVMKTEEALNQGFSGTDFAAANAAARAATQRLLDAITANVTASAADGSEDESTDGSEDDVLCPRNETSSSAKTRENAQPVAMTKIMLYGSAESRETAKRLIDDLFQRAREEKRQRRVDDRERQRDKRARERRMYHLRHAADYERLELPLGASKEDVKSAFRRLAVRWHPDKHPEGPARIAAAERFASIQASYNNLMTTDEEQGMVQSIAHTSVASAAAKRPRPPVHRDVELSARAEFELALKARVAAAEAAAARVIYKNL